MDNMMLVTKYWYIGRAILNFYNNEFVEAQIRRLPTGRDLDEKNILNACRFAQKYTEDQLDQIINSHFTLYWYQLVRNLDIDPDLVIKEVIECIDQDQFDYWMQEIRKAKSKEASPPINTDKFIKNNNDINEHNIDKTTVRNAENISQCDSQLCEVTNNNQPEINASQKIDDQAETMNWTIYDYQETIKQYDMHLGRIMEMVEDNIDRTKIMDYCFHITNFNDYFYEIN
jgi:hypothetical protein